MIDGQLNVNCIFNKEIIAQAYNVSFIGEFFFGALLFSQRKSLPMEILVI